MPNNWWQHLWNKIHGRPFDREKYIQFIDSICFRVYTSRLSSQSVPGLEYEHFRESCWEHIESPRFWGHFFDSESKDKDDAEIEKYLHTAVSTHFTKNIMDLTPGLETRKKQMDRVLKPECVRSCRSWCKCWKLQKLKGNTISKMADMGELLIASQGLQLPVVHYPRENVKKGPAVKDSEMRDYLTSVLKKSGGMTQRNSMIAFIIEKFGLVTIQEQTFLVQNKDNEEEPPQGELTLERLSKLVYESGVDLSPVHILMAQEITEKMNPKQKDVFYKLYVLEWTQSYIALGMNISNSQVHNIKKEILCILQEYFHMEEKNVTFEEVEAVNQLIKNCIEQEYSNNEKKKL